ncbi:MAG: PQQ-like beta-propeller repeat protein [Planctomycetota bacterium]|nr:MAG: PQQ-like beta-propeller repeat protein [Planctomycetota bacterium]
MNRSWVTSGALVFLGLFVQQAWGVKTATWVHEQPKDFTAGKLGNVVVSSLGEVTLGREASTIFESEDDAEVINALARAGDGKIYAATGPYGVIYRIDGEEVNKFATLPVGGTIFSLLFTKDGRLLAGTGGGEQAKIYVIDGNGKVRVFYEPKDARYIWAMARGSGGEIYAATGIEGQLHVVDADGGNGRVLVDVKPKNILCLAFGSDGMLYAGTDMDGLVYRIDPQAGKPFVIYDAKEPEISAIVTDAEGNIYAATASAEGAKPGREIADKPGGKPDISPMTAPPQQSSSTTTKPGDKDESANGKSSKTTTKPTKKKKPSSMGLPVPLKGTPDGNAIYRIDSAGFVTEIFRESVIILSMVEYKGTIYATTGNEGRIYQISPAQDRTTMLAKLEPSQVTALLRMDEGRLLVSTANISSLVWISDGYASQGTLVSKPLDAGQVVKWGRIKYQANLPEGTRLTVATRSSNVEDEESEAWEDYSDEMEAFEAQQIPSTEARFLQYRLTFETTKSSASALLSKLQITRIEENRPPRISTLEVLSAREASQKPGSSSKIKAAAGGAGFGNSKAVVPEYNWVAQWKAEDPNKDPLVYDVFYRALGSSRWIRMTEDIKEALYIWNTRTMADGKYEIRILAKDSKGNPLGTELTYARISDPILIDNTSPEATITSVEYKGGGSIDVRAEFSDSAGSIADAGYTIDSHDEWKPLAADDDIFDSPTESVTFTIDDLKPGEHRIALRIRDDQGNARYVGRSVTIKE